MSLIWRDTITLVRRTLTGERDKYGKDVYNETRTPVSGCSFQSVDSSERHDTSRDQVLSHYRVYIRGFVDVAAVDAVEYGPITAEIHGQPEYNPSPTGRLTHTMIQLRDVRG